MQNKAEQILKQYNQEHIIKHMKNSNAEKRKKIIEQIENIDFEEIKDLYIKTRRKKANKKSQNNSNTSYR